MKKEKKKKVVEFMNLSKFISSTSIPYTPDEQF